MSGVKLPQWNGLFSKASLKRCICYFSKFYPRPSKILHRYICSICDISQLCNDDDGNDYDDDENIDDNNDDGNDDENNDGNDDDDPQDVNPGRVLWCRCRHFRQKQGLYHLNKKKQGRKETFSISQILLCLSKLCETWNKANNVEVDKENKSFNKLRIYLGFRIFDLNSDLGCAT